MRPIRPYRVEVWVGQTNDAGSFMGSPSLSIEAVLARSVSEAERKGRIAASRLVKAERKGITIIAEAQVID